MISIATFSSSQSFAKQYYKWTDSKGSTHYTNTPPPKNAKSKSKIDTYGANHSTVTNTTQAIPPTIPTINSKPQIEQQHPSHQPVQKGQVETNTAPQAQ
nr:DUF4124 domain-containing protein [Acinetobacter sp. ANC 4648]